MMNAEASTPSTTRFTMRSKRCMSGSNPVGRMPTSSPPRSRSSMSRRSCWGIVERQQLAAQIRQQRVSGPEEPRCLLGLAVQISYAGQAHQGRGHAPECAGESI
jgi:hypothetical protein